MYGGEGLIRRRAHDRAMHVEICGPLFRWEKMGHSLCGETLKMWETACGRLGFSD